MMSPRSSPALSAGPPADNRPTLTPSSSSNVVSPSHGRCAPLRWPVSISSSRMGFRMSTGTNMLPGTLVPLPAASRTNSEPTPTSFPDGSISAAPPQSAIGGKVKIASSSRYSQPPVNSRRDVMKAGAMLPRAPAASTGSFSLSDLASPSTIGSPCAGTSRRTRPKPVSWSKPATLPGSLRPLWSVISTSSASITR